MSASEIIYCPPSGQERHGEALLFKADGRVLPLFQGRGRGLDDRRLTDWRGQFGRISVRAAGEVLEVHHAFDGEPHPAGALLPKRPYLFFFEDPNGEEIHLVEESRRSAVATLGAGGWTSSGFRIPSDLIIAPASYFAARSEQTWPAVQPGIRVRLSPLAERELAPC